MLRTTDSLIHKSSLKVPSTLEVMMTILEWFDQFNHAPVTYELWLQGQTALIEGFTNAVRHAHKNLSPQTPVDITVQVSSKYFQICIWDQGDTFNLEAALENLSQKTISHAFHPLNHGPQWGCIFLLKLSKDHAWTISYNRDVDDRNCLILEKKLAS
ncbi:MAG: anti-sigma regulatory factor [Stigonema ocellatum SAG 48.90 = DSM 106950]|nr:anti-sigma regulatory factor [Stigonema ocellatum SAG 48.90 = DSM 106950]